MPLVIGHSQTKYLSEYFSADEYSVYSYSGYRTLQFLEEDCIFDVAPYFSVVVLVVGANDIGSRKPTDIVSDIEKLCAELRLVSPSATILVSEVLPRSQNLFDGRHLDMKYIDRWNHDAGEVNRLSRNLSQDVAWVKIVRHPEFHTMFGANRQLLSRDGLHLSYDGTETLTSNIEESVRSLSAESPIPAEIPISTEVAEPPIIPEPLEPEVQPIYGPMLYSEIVRHPTKQCTRPRLPRSAPVRKQTRTTSPSTSRPQANSKRSKWESKPLRPKLMPATGTNKVQNTKGSMMSVDPNRNRFRGLKIEKARMVFEDSS